jgi:hypothetical protein
MSVFPLTLSILFFFGPLYLLPFLPDEIFPHRVFFLALLLDSQHLLQLLLFLEYVASLLPPVRTLTDIVLGIAPSLSIGIHPLFRLLQSLQPLDAIRLLILIILLLVSRMVNPQ